MQENVGVVWQTGGNGMISHIEFDCLSGAAMPLLGDNFYRQII